MITIRPIEMEDVSHYHAYRRAVLESADTLPLGPGEYPRSLEQDREQVRTIIEHPRWTIIVALDGNRVVGQCAVRGRDIASMMHLVGLGIDVAAAYRGQGIGSRMMADMVTYCRAHPEITRLELEVFANNHKALGLYIKHGFLIEGRKVCAYMKNGQCVDSYIMGMMV